MSFNRGKYLVCKDAIASFNRRSDELKKHAEDQGMWIVNESVSEHGHRMFNAGIHQPDISKAVLYSKIDCFFHEILGEIRGVISCYKPMPYGPSIEYTNRYVQR